ncbi:hypothetical protein TA3x_003588 [Tundrisphaera sp. TA3]|uniref:hypothetical protein n=1 Tax=Tundrisphaera sp. TA3 TaxID=3435775 RepID=UPI003EBA2DC5
MKDDLPGEWTLDGYAFVESGDPIDPPGPAEIASWLLGVTGVGQPRLEARTGLELTIRLDGSYAERVAGGGDLMLWYDSEGVQTASPGPSEGIAQEIAGTAAVSLHPRGALPPRPDRSGGLRDVLRYDDGDTQVSDILQVAGGSLGRVISVVTDGLYLNRVVTRYRRRSGP